MINKKNELSKDIAENFAQLITSPTTRVKTSIFTPLSLFISNALKNHVGFFEFSVKKYLKTLHEDLQKGNYTKFTNDINDINNYDKVKSHPVVKFLIEIIQIKNNNKNPNIKNIFLDAQFLENSYKQFCKDSQISIKNKIKSFLSKPESKIENNYNKFNK